jgi:hypothetical protein
MFCHRSKRARGPHAAISEVLPARSDLQNFRLRWRFDEIHDQTALELGSKAPDSDSVEGATARLEPQPAPDGASLAVEARRMEPDIDEEIVNEVLRVRCRGEHRRRSLRERAQVALVQTTKCVIIPGRATRQQVSILVQRPHAFLSRFGCQTGAQPGAARAMPPRGAGQFPPSGVRSMDVERPDNRGGCSNDWDAPVPFEPSAAGGEPTSNVLPAFRRRARDRRPTLG